MSLSRILNNDNPIPRSTPFPTQSHNQPSRHYRDDSDDDNERALKRRRTSDDPDLDDCPEVWQDELNKYMLQTRVRARHVQQWFDDKCRERNAAVARYAAHDYTARITSLSDRLPPPHRPSSTSIEQDILGTLHDSPPASNGHQFLEDPNYPEVQLRARAKGKRRADSDTESVMVKTEVDGFSSSRKRKLEDNEDLISDTPSSIVLPAKKKGIRGRKVPTGDDSVKPPRKRAPRKPKGSATAGSNSKLPSEEPQQLHHQGPPTFPLSRLSPSIAGSVGLSLDATPVPSAPPSPTLTAVSSLGFGPGFWPLDESIPPLKKPKKMEHTQAIKRVVALEEAQRRVWLTIARKDVVRAYKYHASGHMVKNGHHKRLASMAASQARKSCTRTPKSAKETQTRAKRLMREMLVFWKKNEREERDVRKRAEKEAVDRAKEEEEKREAARQARKLEFLISQTELYSHFVGNKLKTAEAEQLADEHGPETMPKEPSKLPLINDEGSTAPLDDLDFDDEDQTNLHRHAARNAQDAIVLARERAHAFDAQAAMDRRANEALSQARQGIAVKDEHGDGTSGSPGPDAASTSAPIVDLDSDELNFQNPTSLKEMTVAQPRMLMAQLKEYQLKGLNWLATLYEQGINGILADEMGLGKTVQSISLLAYLAETHDIWGPFLVIAPASTLHNWQQEISRFVPGLKALPYWGNVKDRATLRKFWNKKQISYNQDAPFHVLITSYPLVVQDDKYFQRVKWQYMILDEAQAIKSSSSARWKTLLNFQCRNRLLLTGTPVQNSMQELWALLHFIMPSLFDSHDEFSEWFSKDIENAAENKGSKLNEHQLRRLHMILKPFMLRRVKRHVQNELSDKIELDIYCDLSPRQRALYRGLRANISVAELLQKAANLGDADSAMSLMNLVMQFRKVCNHPELFERSDVLSPFSFCTFGHSGNLVREGEQLDCPYSALNPIEFSIPGLFFLDGGLLDVPGEDNRVGLETHWLRSVLSIWATDSINRSLKQPGSTFSFLHLLKISPYEAHEMYKQPAIRQILDSFKKYTRWKDYSDIGDCDFVAHSVAPMGLLRNRVSSYLEVADDLPALNAIGTSVLSTSYLLRPEIHWYSVPATAPPIMMQCASRTFLDRTATILSSPLASLALYGLPASHAFSTSSVSRLWQLLPNIHPLGLLRSSPRYQIPWSPMQVPEGKRLIYDSTKLARLDTLLQELKAGDHRVLIYFQMTKMMDLMEEYLVFRQYKYLRLDGSSKLEDRRDMVFDWQTRPEIFIFLLSTRAGGLGINLTAADTVIFYDHDWNPSNDAQAMDRAHRLGQTRQVTVYRLITRGTIDERIVQLARVKKDVQDIVVGNKQFTEATKPSEIVSLLLNDEELANLGNAPSVVDASASGTNLSEKRMGKQSATAEAGGPSGVHDFWNEEGDGFFYQSNPIPPPSLGMDAEDDMTPPPIEIIAAKKKGKTTGAKRGRKRKVAGI
ncbi:hypothetical protein K439DRAFT_1566811 [Ramaria rubella]|nr:hypothetical protein K439DRAFT_1566811 [Ramaria rubella]